jgi:hypothetical protein
MYDENFIENFQNLEKSISYACRGAGIARIGVRDGA